MRSHYTLTACLLLLLATGGRADTITVIAKKTKEPFQPTDVVVGAVYAQLRGTQMQVEEARVRVDPSAPLTRIGEIVKVPAVPSPGAPIPESVTLSFRLLQTDVPTEALNSVFVLLTTVSRETAARLNSDSDLSMFATTVSSSILIDGKTSHTLRLGVPAPESYSAPGHCQCFEPWIDSACWPTAPPSCRHGCFFSDHGVSCRSQRFLRR